MADCRLQITYQASMQPNIDAQHARDADRLFHADNRALKLLDADARPIELRAAQIGAHQLGISHFRAAQIALVEDHTREIGALKIRLAQIAALKAHALEYGAPELRVNGVAALDQHIFDSAI